MSHNSHHQQLLFKKQTTEGLVEVWQSAHRRSLKIDDVLQSQIDIDRADQLLSPLHHAFLAVLLFIDRPRRVLLAGLGGGAIARYIHSIDPTIEGDAVELSHTVSELSRDYFFFPEKRWAIENGDIKDWTGSRYDLAIVDIADLDVTPAWLTSERMLGRFRRQLSPDGVLVMNLLIDDADAFRHVLISLRRIFARRTLCLSVPGHKNIVVFAFNRQASYRSLNELRSRISELSGLWGLDFDRLLSRLLKDNPAGSGIF